MQTALIIRTLEILPPQRQDSPIIPPQKKRNNDIKRPSTNNLAPDGVRMDIQRRHGRKGRKLIRGIITPAQRQIDRNHNQTPDNAQEDENIPTHLGKSQENRRVEADTVDQLGLSGSQDRFDPCENALSHRRRRVFVVGMFDFWGVDERVTGSEEREEKGEGDGDSKRSP